MNKDFQKIKEQYPEIPLGKAKDIYKDAPYGQGIIPLYRTINSGRNAQYICTAPCGHYFIYIGSELTRKRGIESRSCPICRQESVDLTNQKFGKLTALYPTEKRSSGHIMWHCKCDCGKETDVNISSLKNGSIKSCGCLTTESNGLQLVGQRFGKLVVLNDSGERNNNRNILWTCQCDCGNICKVSSRELSTGDTQSCGCLKFRSSHGELKINNLLKENNINFKSQYQIIINNSYKYFDFAILDMNNNISYIIEYDGKQHFNERDGWEPLEVTQKRDQEKNQWCKDNSIPLIRIPYTHYDNLCIEDLLLNSTSFLIN